MAAVSSVELCYEGFVGVSDDEDGRVESFDVFSSPLMGLDTDGPAALPVFPFPLEPCENHSD